jgi:hypothetical protein
MQTENSYSDFMRLFENVISNNDVFMAQTLLEHVFPALSEDDQATVVTDVFSTAMKEGTSEIQNIFIKKFGLDSGVAKDYIHSCLHDREKGRDILDIVSSYAGVYYGSLLVGAFIMGDLEIAESLFSQNKDKMPELKRYSSVTLIDDQSVSNRSEEMAEVSAQELRRLCEILDGAGLREVVDEKFRILGTKSLNSSKESTRSSPFSGKIPTLDGGVVLDPELFIAFRDQAGKTPFPKVFSKIPCWVKDGDYHSCDDIQVFRVDHVAKSRQEPTSFARVIENHLDEREFKTASNFTLKVSLEAVPGSTKDEAKLVEGTAENLIKNILPQDLIAGFRHPEGYSLALFDTAVLSGMSIGNVDGNNLCLANLFAKDFFPASVLSNAYNHNSSEVINDDDTGINSDDGDDLYSCLLSHDLKSHLLALIPETMWLNLFKKISYKLGYLELIEAKKLFGFDNATAAVRLNNDKDVIGLFESGYKFSDASADVKSVEFLGSDSSRKSHDPSVLIKLIKMGGWPSKLPKPASIADGLTMAIRKKSDPIYNYYLLSAGAEEVIKAAKTPAQFDFIYELFPREDITHLLKLMPKSVRAKHLEDDLGM